MTKLCLVVFKSKAKSSSKVYQQNRARARALSLQNPDASQEKPFCTSIGDQWLTPYGLQDLNASIDF